MTNPDPKLITRRRFIGQASCAAISGISVLNTLLNLRLAGDIAAADPPEPNEYRALVCLFLNGGNDSFNMLVPRGNPEYAEYALERQNLALAQNSLLAINSQNTPGKLFGLHPGMLDVANLFEQGHAAFVANVGTLIEPVTKVEYSNGSVSLPLGLFSHSDQQEQWQTSIPQSRAGTGWAGRMADLLHSLNVNQKVSMNISLAGSNIFQAGNDVFEYAITPNGAVGLNNYTAQWSANDSTLAKATSAAVDSQLAQHYSNLLMQAFANSKRNALDAYDVFHNATNISLPPGVTFPSTPLGPELQMIAKTIAGRTALDVTRQTFFLQLGGWDHHDNVIDNQAAMLPYVSALSAPSTMPSCNLAYRTRSRSSPRRISDGRLPQMAEVPITRGVEIILSSAAELMAAKFTDNIQLFTMITRWMSAAVVSFPRPAPTNISRSSPCG